MFNSADKDLLLKIFCKQNEILKELKNIDDNIIKYLGKEYELEEKKLKEKMLDAKFNHQQFEVVKEIMEHMKEKYSHKEFSYESYASEVLLEITASYDKNAICKFVGELCKLSRMRQYEYFTTPTIIM